MKILGYDVWKRESIDNVGKRESINVENTIRPETGYVLTGTMPGQPKRLCYVARRNGNEITVMLICGLVTAKVVPAGIFSSTEYAKLKTPYGVYNMSPCGKVSDVNDVASVIDIIRNCPE